MRISNDYPNDGWCTNCHSTYLDDADRAQGCGGTSGYCPIFDNTIECITDNIKATNMATAKKSITKVSHKTANTRNSVNKAKQPLYLYKISQDINDGYDTYDSAVVAAHSIADARNIHPATHVLEASEAAWDNSSTWVAFSDKAKIHVKRIGVADAKTGRGLIVTSFNAG